MGEFRHFNSHAHVERDHCQITPPYVILYFNSHAHVERDSTRTLKVHGLVNFNSHAHVERDPIITPFPKFSLNFNSHAHVERDYNILIFRSQNAISTHTLTWSVTLDVVYIWCLLNVMRTYFFI